MPVAHELRSIARENRSHTGVTDQADARGTGLARPCALDGMGYVRMRVTHLTCDNRTAAPPSKSCVEGADVGKRPDPHRRNAESAHSRGTCVSAELSGRRSARSSL